MSSVAALALAALLAPPAPAARADELGISAAVDRNVVAVDDSIVLTVNVLGDQTSLPEPRLPSLPNFSVSSSGRSQSISFVNGRVSSSVAHTYVLAPRFVGRAVIGPITVSVDGRDHSTSPIEIQVVRPSPAGGGPGSQDPGGRRQMPPGFSGQRFRPFRPPSRDARQNAPEEGAPEVFVAAALDKQRAYVNEQVTLTVRFHTAVNLLGNPQYTAPSVQGFLTEDLPPERHGTIQAYGRTYHISEIKYALFPARPGRLAIGPAVVRCQVQTDAAMDPFSPDFFQQFFSQGLLQAQTRELKTRPLALEVTALPEAGKPSSFTGAVGRFRIAAGLDKKRLRAGEAVNLTVSIEGSGNLQALGAPKPPGLDSFRVYTTLSSLTLKKDQDVVAGSKAFKTLLVPRVSGEIVIAPIPFSYFDPTAGKYVSASSARIEVAVDPGEPGKPAPATPPPAQARPELTPLTEDIRYVKDSARKAPLSGVLDPLSNAVWPHLLPLLAFLAGLAAAFYRERLSLDPSGTRLRRALPKALKRLREAEGSVGRDPSRASAVLFDALAGFLADKLDRPPSGLTLRQAQDDIRSKFPGMDERRLAELKALWEGLERLRFAGSTAADAAGAGAILDELRRHLKRLDSEMTGVKR